MPMVNFIIRIVSSATIANVNLMKNSAVQRETFCVKTVLSFMKKCVEFVMGQSVKTVLKATENFIMVGA